MCGPSKFQPITDQLNESFQRFFFGYEDAMELCCFSFQESSVCGFLGSEKHRDMILSIGILGKSGILQQHSTFSTVVV